MYRGTTPTIQWNINNDNLDFSEIEQIWMTFKDSSGNKITKDIKEISIDPDEKTITYEFSQEETLKIHTGIVETQLRVLLINGAALATEIKEFEMDRVLKGGVIL